MFKAAAPPFLWSLPISCLLIVPDVQGLPFIPSTSFPYRFIIYYLMMHMCVCVCICGNDQGGLECVALCPVSAMLLLVSIKPVPKPIPSEADIIFYGYCDRV